MKPKTPAAAGYSEDALLEARALEVLADPTSSDEDRAVAEARLTAKSAEDGDLIAAMDSMSFEQLAALAALDGAVEEVVGDLGLAERRQRAWARMVRATWDAERLAAALAALDDELRQQTGRATPTPAPVTLAAADDDNVVAPVVAEEPISAPRDAEGWREYARACLAKHRAAEAERSAQRTAELEQWRQRERAKIAAREAAERRRRGEE